MSNAVISELHSDRNRCKPDMRRLHEKVLASVGRGLKAFGDRVAKAGRAQRAFEELNAMSDLELEDIGITRADIHAIVAGVYRDPRLTASNVIPLDRRCRMRSPEAPAISRGNLAMLPNPGERATEHCSVP